MTSARGLALWRALAFFLGLGAVLVILLLLIASPRAVGGGQGFLGYEAVPARLGDRSAHRITNFDPESPLREAGVTAGDLILAPPRGTFAAGQPVTLEVAHQGEVRTVTVNARAIGRLATPLLNASEITLSLLAGCLGLLVALRRPRDPGALRLACLFFVATVGMSPQVFMTGPIAALLDAWGNVSSLIALPGAAWFILSFEGGYQSRARPWLVLACGALVTFGLIWGLLAAPYFFGRSWVDPTLSLSLVRPGLQTAGVVLCAVAFIDTWRHAPRERRPRLRWLLCSLSTLLLTLLLVSTFLFGLWGTGPASVVAVSVGSDVLTATGMLLLVYSILRHRVLDVGFVINRALVYAVFTAALLISFGLIEWLVDHFVRFQQRERSQLLDAVIALGLFLAFHRARHWIERFVERVFFGAWHAREAQLERFLVKAPHFSSPEALTAAFLEAVDAYASSRSALYLRDGGGGFGLRAATLARMPPQLAADAAPLIELKAFKEPHPLSAGGLGEGALAIPMLRRAELVGALIVARPPAGESYRPDQLDCLARAAQQVCLDLYALRLEQLEARVRTLEARPAG